MRVETKFTGLCAFVKNPNGRSARIVLVDALPPCDGHETVLLVPVSHWDQSLNKRIPTDRFSDQEYLDEDVVVLPLSKENLFFPRGSTALTFEPGTIVPPCPGGGDRRRFAWVAQMRDFVSNGSMRDQVLTDASPSEVAARISVTSGAFAAGSFRKVPDPATGSFRLIKYQFIDSTGVSDARAFAEEVELTDDVSVISGHYEIGATFFGGTSAPSIVLKEDNHLVRFKVVDLPLDKIKDPDSSNVFEPDECFAQFYRLGSGAVGSILTPLGIGDSCPPPGGGLSNPKCPCACFNDNPNA